MNKWGWITFLVTVVASSGLLTTGAAAQTNGVFPTKPIRIVVGFAAGGPTDVIARIIGQDMSAMFGQSVVVDNRTGANSLIATELVAGANADGYTVLFASLSHNVMRSCCRKPSSTRRSRASRRSASPRCCRCCWSPAPTRRSIRCRS